MFCNILYVNAQPGKEREVNVNVNVNVIVCIPRRHVERRWRVFGMVYAIYALHVRKMRIGHNFYAIFMRTLRSYHSSSTLVYYCISLYDVVHYTILYCTV